MVERSSALAGHETYQPPSAPVVSNKKFAAMLTLLLPFLSGHAPDARRDPTEQKEEIRAPLLSSFSPGTNLLGEKFSIAEGGPEACLSIEEGLLVLTLNGERLVVQKISTYEENNGGVMQRTDWELTPLKVAAYSLIASLEAGDDTVIGRITQFLNKPIEHHLQHKDLLPLANELRNRKHTEAVHVAEWKGQRSCRGKRNTCTHVTTTTPGLPITEECC